MSNHEKGSSGQAPQDMPTLAGALFEPGISGTRLQRKLPQYVGVMQLREVLGGFSLSQVDIDNLIRCEIAGWHAGNVLPLVLNNASVEQQSFATDFLQTVAVIEGSLLSELAIRESNSNVHANIADHIHEVVNGASKDTQAWWGFAPYIYSELVISRGIETDEAMQRLLLWARDGDINKPGDIHLQGLSFLKEGRVSASMYGLTVNPEGESHRFTRLKAVEVADVLLTRDAFDPEKAFT